MSTDDTPKAPRAPRSRFTPQVKDRVRLEERDLELLCDVYLHRAMTRGQIERLYFTSASRCNVRLRQLFDHGLVERYYPPIAVYGAQCVYSLGSAGISYVARRLDLKREDVERQAKRHKTPQFLEHTLAINEARLAFRDALAASPEWRLERWVSELKARHEYDIRAVGGEWAREVFKPDGFLRAQHRSTAATANFFLEIDMGHTSASKFAEKVDSYTRYWGSGLFQKRYGQQSFLTLVITTGPRRLKNLQEVVEQRRSHLFVFSTFEETKRVGILGGVWYFPLMKVPGGIF